MKFQNSRFELLGPSVGDDTDGGMTRMVVVPASKVLLDVHDTVTLVVATKLIWLGVLFQGVEGHTRVEVHH